MNFNKINLLPYATLYRVFEKNQRTLELQSFEASRSVCIIDGLAYLPTATSLQVTRALTALYRRASVCGCGCNAANTAASLQLLQEYLQFN